MFRDLIDILFPRSCPVCGRRMHPSERCVCLNCLVKLPRAFAHLPGNEAETRMSGRIPFEHGGSFCYYTSHGMAATIVRKAKFHNMPWLDDQLARLMAQELPLYSSAGLPREEDNQAQSGAEGPSEAVSGLSGATEPTACPSLPVALPADLSIESSELSMGHFELASGSSELSMGPSEFALGSSELSMWPSELSSGSSELSIVPSEFTTVPSEPAAGMGAAWPYDIDCIIPIPIHWFRRIQRGYNQSTFIAEALADEWHLPVVNDCLIKRTYTRSQVGLHGQERLTHVEGSFFVRHPERLEGRHILLVDDVLTTGATLVAAYDALRSAVSDFRISFLTLTLTAE